MSTRNTSIPPRSQRAARSKLPWAGVSLIAAGAAVTAASLGPAWGMSVVVICAIAVFALGWGRLVHGPAPATSGAVIMISGLLAGALVQWTMDAASASVAGGFVLLIAFLAEMLRGRKRKSVGGSLATTVTGSLFALFGMPWVALEGTHAWLLLAFPMGICLMASGLCFFLRGPIPIRVTISVVTGTLAGLGAVGVVTTTGLGGQDSVLVASASVGLVQPLFAMLVVFGCFGLTAGCTVAACHAFFIGKMAPTRVMPALALGIVPMLVVAIPLYVFARVGGG